MTRFHLSAKLADSDPVYTSLEFRDVFGEAFASRAVERVRAMTGREDVQEVSPEFGDEIVQIAREAGTKHAKGTPAGEVRQKARDTFLDMYGKKRSW